MVISIAGRTQTEAFAAHREIWVEPPAFVSSGLSEFGANSVQIRLDFGANSVQILNTTPYPQTHESARPKRISLKWAPPQKLARVKSAHVSGGLKKELVVISARFRLDF